MGYLSERNRFARSLLSSYIGYFKFRQRLKAQRKKRWLRFLRQIRPHAAPNPAGLIARDHGNSSPDSLTLSVATSTTSSSTSTSSTCSLFSSSDISLGNSSNDADNENASSASETFDWSSDSSSWDAPVPDLISVTTDSSDDEDDDMDIDSTSEEFSDDTPSTPELSSLSDTSKSPSDPPHLHLFPRTSLSRRVRRTIDQLFARRYWKRGRQHRPRPPGHLTYILKHHDDDCERFRRELRIDPPDFFELVEELEDDPVFTNASSNSQMPVARQVAIALYRFGHFGNAASLNKVAQWAGCAKGTVTLATRRVMTAVLRPHFLRRVVRLPTQQEKREAKRWVAQRSCRAWRGGWCMVDGTLIPLHTRPNWYGPSYYDRKCNYSLNLQVVSLPNLRIIDYGYGYTGSTHDSTAWENTRTFKEREEIFEGDEFIWADSAYPIQTWVVCPYKKPLSDLNDNTTFNNFVSKIRIWSEHAIGFLKGRFQSLKGLRVNIGDDRSHKFANYWTVACIAVHEFAREREARRKGKGYTDADTDSFIEAGLSDNRTTGAVHASTEPDPAPTGRTARASELSAAKRRRERLKEALLTSFRGESNSDESSDDDVD